MSGCTVRQVLWSCCQHSILSRKSAGTPAEHEYPCIQSCCDFCEPQRNTSPSVSPNCDRTHLLYHVIDDMSRRTLSDLCCIPVKLLLVATLETVSFNSPALPLTIRQLLLVATWNWRLKPCKAGNIADTHNLSKQRLQIFSIVSWHITGNVL